MTGSFLDKVYKARTARETREIYDAWSKSYDAEVTANAYATPARCADALKRCAPDLTAPLLDFGCGTGLSGAALHKAGFSTIDGCDLSDEMLRQAAKKGVYRKLTAIGAEDPVPTGYTLMSAIGVIGAGAAPLAVLDRLIDALAPGGLFVFSFNDHTLADAAFEGRVDALLAGGAVLERFREHGPHLPGRDLKSTVYVIEKA